MNKRENERTSCLEGKGDADRVRARGGGEGKEGRSAGRRESEREVRGGGRAEEEKEGGGGQEGGSSR